jgi:hypothetical protein
MRLGATPTVTAWSGDGRTAVARKRSDRLGFDGDLIGYEAEAGSSWTLRISDLLVLGEFTNDAGPFMDDYCYVFVAMNQKCYAASFYSEGREAFLQALEQHLHATLDHKLTRSTDRASNVLWPPDIAGQPLYEFREQETVYSQPVVAKLESVRDHVREE